MVVPEGIHHGVNIYMSYAIEQLQKKNIIVKDMIAFQQLSFVNSIVTDKTGFIT